MVNERLRFYNPAIRRGCTPKRCIGRPKRAEIFTVASLAEIMVVEEDNVDGQRQMRRSCHRIPYVIGTCFPQESASGLLSCRAVYYTASAALFGRVTGNAAGSTSLDSTLFRPAFLAR